MFLFKTIPELKEYLGLQKGNEKKIGFVPTMGALHKGHLALLEQSKKDGCLPVCSIFVNPTQFNNPDDFKKYPRTLEQDIKMLYDAGCEVLFHPDPEEVYPNGMSTEHYDWGNVTNLLEGAFRPGHFDGVITIVKKLLEIVEPEHVYFGQKDFQQCMVIREMIQRYQIPTQMRIIPTLREIDGLAMSSRNTRLNEAERKDAVIISETLSWMKQESKRLSINDLQIQATERINRKLKTEYVEILDADTFSPIDRMDDTRNNIALIAAWCGNVRLIDNLLLTN